MHSRRTLAVATSLAAGLLVIAGSIGGALAARPALFQIAIDFDDPNPTVETFTSDSPLLCSDGEAFTDFHRFGGGPVSAGGSFHLDKLIVCDDGSGTFVIRVDAGTNFVVGAGTQGGWSVVPGSGTGDYVGLKGGGNIVGVNQTGGGDVDLIDYYFGRVGF